MSNTLDKSSVIIAETASEWFVASRDGEMSYIERRAFAAWLRESPVHIAEYLAISRLWGDAGKDEVTANLAQLLSEKGAAGRSETIVRFPTRSETRQEARSDLKARGISIFSGVGFWPQASVAAVMLLFLSLGLALVGSPVHLNVYSTARGQHQTIFMEDGSVIDLNTNSEIIADFKADKRLVRLRKGEAYFDVAPDPSRPFIVVTDKAVIRVTGTRFNILHSQAATNVTVIEGKVEVTAADHDETGSSDVAVTKTATTKFELIAGNQVIVEDNHRITRRAVDQLNAVIAWKEQRLIFNNKSLKEIVAEFRRYNDINYEILDPDTANRRFSGVFNSDDPDSFLSYLQRLPEIDVSRYGNSALIQRSTQ